MEALVIHGAGDLRVEKHAEELMSDQQLQIRVRFGGICGSDLHYYQHGGFGTIRVQEPMILGHEISGFIETLGKNVVNFHIGERVAISPSRPCQFCEYCQKGLQNHCLDMRYYGSAMRMPHIQGAFRQSIVVDPSQVHRLGENTTDEEGAMVEPFAVALHAVNRAGPLLGKKVLVTGCGPIGALLIIAARRAGAAQIVATDLADFPLQKADDIGADVTHNLKTQPDALGKYKKDKGQFDILFEASGNEQALRGAFDVLKPRGIVVQVGLGGDMSLPINQIVAKEFDLRGSFRFHEEFSTAIALLNAGLVNLKPLISFKMPYKDPMKAFRLAADRTQAMKVLLDFK